MSRARLFIPLIFPIVVGSAGTCARPGGATADATLVPDAPVAGEAPAGDARDSSEQGDLLPRAPFGRTPATGLGQTLMGEIQSVVDHGGDAARMGQIIAEYTGQQDALLSRKTALYVLKSFPARPARLAALLEGGSATPVAPEEDPLWGELISVLSETWARENIVEGRRRMMREPRPRARRLLVSSIAIYAASNRGLSDLRGPARRALAREFTRLFPTVPAEQQRHIDAALPRLTEPPK